MRFRFALTTTLALCAALTFTGCAYTPSTSTPTATPTVSAPDPAATPTTPVTYGAPKEAGDLSDAPQIIAVITASINKANTEGLVEIRASDKSTVTLVFDPKSSAYVAARTPLTVAAAHEKENNTFVPLDTPAMLTPFTVYQIPVDGTAGTLTIDNPAQYTIDSPTYGKYVLQISNNLITGYTSTVNGTSWTGTLTYGIDDAAVSIMKSADDKGPASVTAAPLRQPTADTDTNAAP